MVVAEREALPHELYPFVPREHHTTFWQRYWAKVSLGPILEDEPVPPRLTPVLADELWAKAFGAEQEEERNTCPLWQWAGALNHMSTYLRSAQKQDDYPYYGRVVVQRKEYSAHRLAWSYFNGQAVPLFHQVRRHERCRMFTIKPEWNQLCMWPGCLRLERDHRIPPVEQAYSVRLTDEGVSGEWYRNCELAGGVWVIVDYTEHKPRFVVVDE